MSYRRLRTLLDLAIEGFNVRVECCLCGRWRILEAGPLFWRYRRRGWSQDVDRVHEHLRCAGCDHQELRVSIVDKEPTAAQPPRRSGPIGVVRRR